MKTRSLVLAVIFLVLFAASAFADTAPVPPRWIKQFGSAQIDYVKGIVTDASGNVYVAGTTHGAMDEETLLAPLPSKGGSDVFVARFDPQGSLLWVIQFGSEADDYAEGITLGEQYGNVSLYVAGSTMGGMPVGIEQDPTVQANINKGGSDAYIAKINANSGTIRWIKQFGTSSEDVANGVATDSSGMVYVIGSTTGSIDGMTETGGIRYAFIKQFDATGSLSFPTVQFSIGSQSLDTCAYAIAVCKPTSMNGVNYIYVTGIAKGYEKGPLFVTKFDQWLGQIKTVTLGDPSNGSDSDTGRAIAVDSKGNVIVAGSTQGNFDGNAWSGAEDIVVVKYTAGLTKLWSHQFGTDSNDVAYGVAVDAEDSIYITGITGYPGGSGLDGQTHLGAYDIFLTRFAADGRKLLTRQLGTAGHDWAYGVGIDFSGAVYVAGATEAAMGDQNSGVIDAVVVKYDPDGPVPPPVTDFFINGTVQELPSGAGLESVSVTVKDELGQVVGDYLTDSTGRFSSKFDKAGKYFIHKLKIGYRAQVDPDVVTVTDAAPSAAPVSYMEKIVVKTEMSFRKGYNTVRFATLPAGDRSVNAVFGRYAGHPYVGLIFSFDRPMQYLLLSNYKTVGNLKTLEFGRSYLIYTSRAFTLDTTSWVSQKVLPATALPSTKYRGKVSY